jgi:hypothetical protein
MENRDYRDYHYISPLKPLKGKPVYVVIEEKSSLFSTVTTIGNNFEIVAVFTEKIMAEKYIYQSSLRRLIIYETVLDPIVRHPLAKFASDVVYDS